MQALVNRLRPWRWSGPFLWLARPRVILIALLILGVLARVPPIAANRFHPDEALYSDWALRILSGQDTMLSGVPVDKPPLFLYILALAFGLFGPTEAAARLPSLLAGTASIALAYGLGRRLYGTAAGLVAATLMAASPFNVLFSATAFTDPLMVALVLASCWAVADGRPGLAGVFLGLAEATKQQALFFLPLVIGLAVLSGNREIGNSSIEIRFLRENGFPRPAGAGHLCLRRTLRCASGTGRCRQGGLQVAKIVAGFLLAFAPAVAWDLLRAQQPGFLTQGLLSYGGLTLTPRVVGEQMTGWLALLRYGTAAPALNTIFAAGLPVLLLYDLLARWPEEGSRRDLLLVGFAVFFLLAHSVLSFKVWDRYLLGLMPVLALLLTRVLLLPYAIGYIFFTAESAEDAARPGLRQRARKIIFFPLRSLRSLRLKFAFQGNPGPWAGIYGYGMALLLAATLALPLRDAAASRFPVGGDHGAYAGIDAVAAYFRGHVPSEATLYHQALGYHFRFYLHDSPYLFRWYQTAQELATDARQRAGSPRYVVFPAWQSATETRLALEGEGLVMHPVYQVYRDDGSVSFTVYEIVEIRGSSDGQLASGVRPGVIRERPMGRPGGSKRAG
jgi:hypothetical protein